ncbi:Metallo-dependent phosphatase-like protein [Amylostereum chailletii]|nr:Metallo-dependent phosphatase-like protein [Amylostereum chailletii]
MAQPSSRSAGMKAALCALLAGAAFNLVEACADGHQDHDDHGHQSRLNPNVRRASPSSPFQLPPPTRPLEWGDVNIIHTTDSHGWLLGHQKASEPEPNYSGDLGEFASFVAHMKEIAERKGVDLLLVDSGDLHDGTGLTDGFPAGGVDGHDALQYFAQLPYDLLAIGNHELYVYNDTLDVHRNLVPKFNGRYLSSNVNITVPDAAGNLVSVPVGNRYVKFTTAKGRKVTSLGVLFDFTGNDDNTTVQKVEDMVKEAWLAEAIQEEPDFFLLTGHMPVSNDKWPLVFNAIRAVHPQTPILILGGHTHIRDCVQLDGRSMALESGRYMETVGWMSEWGSAAPYLRGVYRESRRESGREK